MGQTTDPSDGDPGGDRAARPPEAAAAAIGPATPDTATPDAASLDPATPAPAPLDPATPAPATSDPAPLDPATLDALPVGIIRHDAAGRITFANVAAGRLLGLAAGDLLGRTCDAAPWRRVTAMVDGDGDVTSRRDHPVTICRLTGEPVRHDVVPVDAADGVRRWLEVTADPVHDARRQLVGVVTSVREVVPPLSSARDRDGEATDDRAPLEVGNAELAAAVRLSADPILVVDRGGRVRFANAAAAELESILGGRLVLGERCVPFRSGVIAERQSEDILASCLAGMGWSGEVAVRIASVPDPASPGAWRWLDVAATPLKDADGRVEAIAVAQRDVSDRVREERTAWLALAGAEVRAEISSIMAEDGPPAGRLRRVIQAVLMLGDMRTLHGGCIAIRDLRTGAFEVAATVGEAGEAGVSRCGLMEEIESLAERLNVEGRPRDGQRVLVMGECSGTDVCPGCRHLGPHGHVLVPLMAGSRCQGVMVLAIDQAASEDSAPIRELEQIGELIGHALVRDRLSEAMRRLAWRMRAATSAAGVGVWELELETGTLIWDDTMFTLYGVDPTASASTYEAWCAAVEPEDLAEAEAKLQAAITGERCFDASFRIRRPDGELRYLLGTATVECDAEGRPVRVIGTNIDVTEEREKTLALREAQEVGRIGDWGYDPRSGAMRWSEQLFRMLGRDPQSGQPTLDDVVGSLVSRDARRFLSAVQAAAASGESFTMTVEFRDAAAPVRFLAVEGRARLGGGREVVGLYGTAMDVTGQVQRERSLREITTALDAAHDCIFMFDAETLQFVYANRGATEQVGHSVGELAGMTPLDIMPSHDAASLADLLRPLIDRPGRARTIRTVHRHRDGRDISVEIVLQLVPSLGANGRFIAVVRDIGGQLAAERELEAARDAAEKASRSKSEFLANMSHEIRTPMTAILGYAEMLGDERDVREDPEQVIRAVRTIRTNAGHLLALINDILDVSKIEAGRMTMERVAMRPATIVGEVVDLMRPRAETKEITLDVTWDSPVPAVVLGDPTRLRQVLVNLVGNAIKFTSEGGVRIGVGIEGGAGDGGAGDGGAGDGGTGDGGAGDGGARDGGAGDGGAHGGSAGNGSADGGGGGAAAPVRLRFAVSDTGVGMSEEQRSEVARFEAFAQADGSVTRRFGGTGLGLRISNSLAVAMGGGLSVVSELGRGSTFTAVIAAQPSVEESAWLDPASAAAEVATMRAPDAAYAAAAGGPADAAYARGEHAAYASGAVGRTGTASGQSDARMGTGTGTGTGASVGAEAGAEASGGLESSGESLGSRSSDSSAGRASSPSSVSSPSSGSSGPLTGLRILLVEDGVDNQRLITFHLERAGAEVVLAGDGQAALDAVRGAAERGERLDLVLMDMQMPVLDGYSATRSLRAAGERLPVLALTAHAMEGDRARCLEAGCDDYLTKPIDRSRLIERCRAWGRGEAASESRAA